MTAGPAPSANPTGTSRIAVTPGGLGDSGALSREHPERPGPTGGAAVVEYSRVAGASVLTLSRNPT